MSSMTADRSWMYQKFLPNGRLNTEWCKGVLQFIDTAFNTSSIISGVDGKEYISCPCASCINVYSRDRETVTSHLLRNGFCNNYEIWHEHGEVHPREAARIAAQSNGGMQEMIMDAAGPDFPWEDRDADETPHSKAREFFQMLVDSEEPLWEIEVNGETITCENHSVLSAITRFLDLKAEHQLSQKCFNGMLEIVRSMLPTPNKLPLNFYETKKRVKGLTMDYKIIDVCINFCMLYYKDRENKECCDFCKEPRYEPTSRNKNAKRVPRKVIRYLPITDRLQRMYMTRSTARHMRWHKEGIREKPGLMVHPADGEAWKSFDNIHPEFAFEVRNVRLGLSSDGFMPYNSSAAPYSCWPVFLFPYNLPPGLLMKEDTMFLSLLIPGHPGRDIDICLEPLVDELKELWTTGKLTYDVSRKENFNMKACLMWTVSDFPAYALLSGWSTHGRLSCTYCMSGTKSFRLVHGGKATWFGCHRCFLQPEHTFRLDRKNFLKNKIDTDDPPRRLSGQEVLNEINRVTRGIIIRWGKKVPLDQIPGYNEDHNWQKKSIFWNLPYWKTLLIRHNLDIMHLEKNFMEALLFMLLNLKKTKDNAKARQDLALYCNRPKLNLKSNDSRKPKAPYALTLAERREVLKWLKEEVKFPDGYAANLCRCINLVNGTITGLKSHDYHIFMERLLPAAFRDYVPDSVWEPLCEISSFFREICAKELDPVRLEQIEKDVVVTICKLEKQFPPGFFDSMQHLVIHAAYEAKVGGPVHCRWMYSSERRNKEQRRRVTNKARVEGSIIEATLIKEIANFFSKYFSEASKDSDNEMHEDGQDNNSARAVIFEGFGRPLVQGKPRTLNADEYKAAHDYVLLNCPEIQPLLLEFEESIKNSGRAPTHAALDNIRKKEFASWLRKRVLTDRDFDPKIRNIGLMPKRQVTCYEGYEVNGFRFHTRDYGRYRTRDNSGVLVKGECTDGPQRDYYGILEDIIELEYERKGTKVVLFKCRWFDVPNGVRVDDRHGLIEVKHTSTLQTGEPFIFACQATQVYYLPYASKKRERQQWWIVMQTKIKGNLGVEDVNNPEFFQEEQPNCPIAVTLGEEFNWENVTINENDFELVDPADLSKRTATPTTDYDNESDNASDAPTTDFNGDVQHEGDASQESDEDDWAF